MRGRTDFYGGGIPWLKSGEVANPMILSTEETITESGLAESSAWLVPAGTVVIAMYGATAGQIGYLGKSMATNQAVLALIADEEVADSRFLYHWLMSRSQTLKTKATGAAQPNLSKAVVLREAGFPSIELMRQREIAAVLDSLSAAAEALANELGTLRAFRSSLLTALLSQTITIPEAYDAVLEVAA